MGAEKQTSLHLRFGSSRMSNLAVVLMAADGLFLLTSVLPFFF